MSIEKKNNSGNYRDIYDIYDIMATNHLTQSYDKLIYFNNQQERLSGCCRFGYCGLTIYPIQSSLSTE